MNGCACVFVRASAVRMYTVPVRGLGMNERACLFVRASAVRMCTVPVLGLGMVAYSLPGGVYGQNSYWPCALHFYVCTCDTVFDLGSASSVSCMCVCVCTAVGMCSPSVVPLAVSTCIRALYSIWHGGLGGVGSIHECYLHVCSVRVPLEQYLAWLVRAMYLSCSCLYCACTIAQCVMCLYSLYSVLAWPARVYLLTRACTRTVLVPSHSVYRTRTVAQCVLCLYPLYSDSAWPARTMYVCTVLVPLVQWSGMVSTGNALSARFCTRTVRVLLHSVYCACTSCRVVWYGQHG